MEFNFALHHFSENITKLKTPINLSLVLSDIGEELLTSVDRRFDKEETADGKKWPKSWRAKNGGKTLSDTTHFRRSFTKNVDGYQVEIGTNWKWANTHHYGARIKPKKAKRLAFQSGGQMIFAKEVNIPARPVLGVSQADENLIEAIVLRKIKGMYKT